MSRNKFYLPAKKSPTIVLTQAELNKIKETVKKETVDKLCKYDVEVLLTCFAYTLRCNYHWGYKRIFRVLHSVDMLFGKVLNDEMSDDDMRQMLEDEVGIRISCDGGQNSGIEA